MPRLTVEASSKSWWTNKHTASNWMSIDVAAEKARLAKALETSQKEAKSLAGRLSNPSFVEKAKPEAIAKARADHAHHAAEAERLAAALARLG